MSTLNRIVLCDARGDELFSGSSLLADLPPPQEAAVDATDATDANHATGEDEEPIPATLRSTVLASEPPSRPIIVEEADLSAA